MTRLNRWFYLALLLTATLFLIPPESSRAADRTSCVVLVVNSLTLAEVTGGKMPQFAKQTDRMGAALLNIKAHSNNNPVKILLGISAGAPAQANADGKPFLHHDEIYNRIPAKKLYVRFFGREPETEIFNPFYASLSLQNEKSEFVNEIGYIGNQLHARGRKTGYWGEGDPDSHTSSRPGGLIAADANGRIDYGQVGEGIRVEDPLRPAGKRIDEQKLWKAYAASAKKVSLSVIEWGEFEALDYWYAYIPRSRYDDLRTKSLFRLESFVERLLRDCSSNNRTLVILSTAIPKDPRYRERMGWVLVYDPLRRSHGLLSSATTRTPGLVTPYDLHVFLTEILAIPPSPSSIGAPITVKPGDFQQLLRFNSSIVSLEEQRTPILIFMIYLFAVMLIIGGAAVLLVHTYSRIHPWLNTVLLWTMLIPLAFSIASVFKPAHMVTHLLIGAALALLILLVVNQVFPPTTKRLEIIGLLTVGWLLADACTNGYFSRWSVLGYSLASGARYYGLGNEYTGILLGSALLTAGLFLQRAPNRPMALGMIGFGLIMLPFVIGFPRFGANFGDLVPIIPAFGITFILMGRWRINLKNFFFLLCIVIVVFSLFILYDASHESPTHLGRLYKDIANNGWQVAGLLIQRKLEMNWKLVQYSRWTMIVILVVIIFPIALYSPRGPLRSVFARYPALRSVYIGISLAAIGVFLFNDSGIVAAATTLLLPSIALLILMMKHHESGVD
jgi:hypothetical protein